MLGQHNPYLLTCPFGSVKKIQITALENTLKEEMTKKRGENKDSSQTENYEKKQPSAFLVSMLPFQGLVLTSLSQATRSFFCFSSTFNHNIGSNKLIYMKENLSLDM